jgi:small GTP-binding protein
MKINYSRKINEKGLIYKSIIELKVFGSKDVYKVIILGDPYVGKTALRKRFMGEGFSYNYMLTIGADFSIYHLNDNTSFQIWDLAGQKNFEIVRQGYYKGSFGAIIVFDISRPQTFETIPTWIDEMQKNTEGLIPFVLVGNKSDLREEAGKWAVPRENAEAYAEVLRNWAELDVPYIESSALTGLNVSNIFEGLFEEILAMQSTK